jgi:hypothetical protein
VVNGKLYIDHDEDNYETIDHECDLAHSAGVATPFYPGLCTRSGNSTAPACLTFPP